jgi:hypothetical protein
MTNLHSTARVRRFLATLAVWTLVAASASALGQAAPGRDAAAQAEAAAEAGVRNTLLKYKTALESLDPDAVRKVQPSIRVESLAKAFRDMRELKVDIDEVRVLSVEGPIARVSCRVTQTLTPRVGTKQTTAVSRVLRLRRESDVWLIEGFER